MKNTSIPFIVLLIAQFLVPVFLQSVQSRRYRPQPKEGYIEEADHDEDYRSDKDRPPELTRDDWPVRPQDSEYGVNQEDSLKPGGGRPTSGSGRLDGGYNPNPPESRDGDLKVPIVKFEHDSDRYNPKLPIDRDDNLKPVRPSGGGGGYGYGSGHNPKPVIDRDDNLKPVRPSGGGGGYGYGGGHNPKPAVDRDDNLKPVRPSGGGGYNPKPVDKDEDKPVRGRPGGGYGGGHPKPVVDRDDNSKIGGGRPSGGSGGYGSGHNTKPVLDRDDYDTKDGSKDGEKGRPGGGYITKPGGSGYYPKPDEDDYEIKPSRGGGGYHQDDDHKPNKEDLGGYDKVKDDDYNDDYKDDKTDDYYDDKSKPISVVDDCICVPYYQCTDGHIVTDGAGIIDARKRPDPGDELPLDGKFKPPSCGPFHVCCSTPETSTVRPYEHRCGVRNPSGINSRILSPSNKGEADFGEWPWQAAVLKSEGKVNIFMCGGVLIDKYHVLTVAHCVFHLYEYNEYPLKVRLGEWDTQTTTEFLAHEDYRVSKIIVHPEFRNTSLWNDLAVLRLQDPVLFAPHIDTVCLPQYDEAFDGQNCVVTGWGKDAYKGGTFSNVMKEVALQVIDNYKCEELLRKTRLGRFFQLHQGFMCAGGEYGLDSCKGDGGGPLVCYRKDKSYALAGIVSWGIDCGQPGVPGVYVKMQKYLDWISKTTGVTLQEYWPKTF